MSDFTIVNNLSNFDYKYKKNVNSFKYPFSLFFHLPNGDSVTMFADDYSQNQNYVLVYIDNDVFKILREAFDDFKHM